MIPGQKYFNRLVIFGDLALTNGYAKAWFTWLEWVGLTGVLWYASSVAESWLATIAAIISFVLVLFVAVAYIEKKIDKYIDNRQLSFPAALTISLIGNFYCALTFVEICRAIFLLSSK